MQWKRVDTADKFDGIEKNQLSLSNPELHDLKFLFALGITGIGEYLA